MASTSGTFRSGPGTSLCPRNHPLNALNAFQTPPSTAWLFLRSHHLGFCKSVLLLSYIVLPELYLDFFLNGLNNRPSVTAPGRASHRLIDSLQELAAWLLLVYH